MNMEQRYKILVVENDITDQMALKRLVEMNGLPYTLTTAGSISEAQLTLTTTEFDVILIDYHLKDGTAFDLFKQTQDTPIIVITETQDIESAVKAMKSGAADYLTKDPDSAYLETLPITLEKIIRQAQAEKELKQYREQLEGLVQARTAELAQANIQLSNEIAERKKAEEEARLRAESLAAVNEMAIECVTLSATTNIFKILAEKLKAMTRALAVSIATYDPNLKELTVQYLAMDDTRITHLNDLIGHNIVGMRIKVPPKLYKAMLEETIAIRDGLSETTFGTISKPIANTIQKLFNVQSFAGLALQQGNELLGSVVIALPKGHPGISTEIAKPLAHIIAITLRREKAEEERQESERRFRTVVETAQDSIFIKDRTLHYTQVNPAMEKFFGLPASQLIGQTDEKLFGREGAKAIRAADLQVLAGEINKEEHTQIVNGVPITFSVVKVPIRDKTSEIIAICGIARDITERKQAEAQLEASEEKYREIVELSPVAIVTVDLKGFVTDCNTAFLNITGFSRGEIVGKHFSKIPTLRIRDLSTYAKLFKSLIRGTPSHPIAFTWQHKDGSPRLAEAHMGLMKRDSKITGLQGIIIDTTEQKRTEKLLKALNETATTLQVITRPEEIFVNMSKTFGKLGLSYALLFSDKNQSLLFPEYFTYELKAVKTALKLLGIQNTNITLPIETVPVFKRVIKGRETLFIDKQAAEEATQQAFPKPLKHLARQVLSILNVAKSISAPLIIDNQVVGLLSVQSDELIEEDLPTITAFAHQVAAAWRRAELFTQLQQELADRRRVEQALRENEKRFRALVQNSSDIIMLLENDGVVRYISPSVERILGYAPAYAIGENVFTYVHPEDIRATQAAFEKSLQQPGALLTTEFRIRNAAGNWVHFETITNNLLDTSGVEAIVVNARDTTERKRAEEERERLLAQIQEQAQQTRKIMDTVPEAVILLTPEGQIMLMNPIAEKYLNVLAQARLGDKLTHLGDRPLTAILTSPPKGLWHEITTNTQTFQVIARSIETSAMPKGWVLVIHDITQERDLQNRAQQQERLAAVGQLAAGIAHDFNNIMAVIVLYVQMAQLTQDLPPELKDRLQTVVEQARRATDLIQQILDFSRKAVLERRPIDLLPFLKEQVKLLQRTLPEHIKIDLSYLGGEESLGAYTVNVDPTRIQQMIMNLAVNARDAMPDGGNLHITLSRTDKRVNCVSCGPTDGQTWVCITIKDTGVGVPPNIIPHIFEPFFTTKPPGEGTGLGLAQVYGIVKQHDGHIDIKSQQGEGTTFLLYLPAFALSVPETSETQREEFPQGHNELILVVEDQPATREAIMDSLDILNYRTLSAGNGLQALAFLEQQQEEIALILSDVVMPEMGGIALFHALKQHRISIPLILMTGHPMGEELDRLKEEGISAWILKPPSLEQLAQTIKKVIETCAANENSCDFTENR